MTDCIHSASDFSEVLTLPLTRVTLTFPQWPLYFSGWRDVKLGLSVKRVGSLLTGHIQDEKFLYVNMSVGGRRVLLKLKHKRSRRVSVNHLRFGATLAARKQNHII